MSDIKTLQEKVDNFIKERDWEQFHTPKNIAMSVAIEAAELMEHFQWYTTQQSLEIIEDNRAEIEDEVADVMIYLLSFANTCNIDLFKAVTRKMERNNGRFPIEKVKGKFH